MSTLAGGLVLSRGVFTYHVQVQQLETARAMTILGKSIVFMLLVRRTNGFRGAYLDSTRPSESSPAVSASHAACQAESAG
jgi:hypothetical protein